MQSQVSYAWLIIGLGAILAGVFVALAFAHAPEADYDTDPDPFEASNWTIETEIRWPEQDDANQEQAA